MPSKRFWIGAAIALAMVMSYNYAVAATMRASNDAGEVLLLHDAPCTNQTILQLVLVYAPTLQANFQAGEYVSLEGKQTPMCWTLLPSLQVAVIHEDGAGGLLPMQAFAPVQP